MSGRHRPGRVPRPLPWEGTNMRWYVYRTPDGRVRATVKKLSPGAMRPGEALVAVERGCTMRAAVSRHKPAGKAVG